MIDKKTGPDLALGGWGVRGRDRALWGRAVQIYYRAPEPTQKNPGLRPKVAVPLGCRLRGSGKAMGMIRPRQRSGSVASQSRSKVAHGVSQMPRTPTQDQIELATDRANQRRQRFAPTGKQRPLVSHSNLHSRTGRVAARFRRRHDWWMGSGQTGSTPTNASTICVPR